MLKATQKRGSGGVAFCPANNGSYMRNQIADESTAPLSRPEVMDDTNRRFLNTERGLQKQDHPVESLRTWAKRFLPGDRRLRNPGWARLRPPLTFSDPMFGKYCNSMKIDRYSALAGVLPTAPRTSDRNMMSSNFGKATENDREERVDLPVSIPTLLLGPCLLSSSGSALVAAAATQLDHSRRRPTQRSSGNNSSVLVFWRGLVLSRLGFGLVTLLFGQNRLGFSPRSLYFAPFFLSPLRPTLRPQVLRVLQCGASQHRR